MSDPACNVDALGSQLGVGVNAPEICVVGRCDFGTGIGLLTYAFAEMWSRNLPTCILPTEPNLRSATTITLPNGRVIPTLQKQNIKASIFVDVLWNGLSDQKYLLAPETGLRLACVVWDSDQFSEEYISILNNRFDAAITTSVHLNYVLKKSGCKLPIISVPPALDLDGLMKRPFKIHSRKLRIGSIAAFHPRKGTPVLLDAFSTAFANDKSVELLIHSNLVFLETLKSLEARNGGLDCDNVTFSSSNLSIEDKSNLLESMDIFVNLSQGEGYSIGAREALALGKVCVLSDNGGHSVLSSTPGVFMVPAIYRVPARYPEIDNRIIGEQRGVSIQDATTKLQEAVEYCKSTSCRSEMFHRRERAADFSFSRLSTSAASLISPQIKQFRNGEKVSPEVEVNAAYDKLAISKMSGRNSLSCVRHRVVQMHDGGFFSIFNTFFSHLVWDLKDNRCHRTLPDWDVNRFLERQKHAPIVSFCYGLPDDGNIWTKIFEPLYGLHESDMQNEKTLYDNACLPSSFFNEQREPLLTYIHAYQLYQRPWFSEFRKEYHKVLRDHIIIEPRLRNQVKEFKDTYFHGRVMLGAHVRHPSHTVEQPNAVIARADTYISMLRAIAEEKQLKAGSWGVFLATDQDRVVERFRDSFGEQLCVWTDVRRTTHEEDARFESLDLNDRNRDGFQLQHLVAASPNNWSVEMAREVVRDAYLMAECDTLLHVVSNVSTAVSFINPRCHLRFCG